jgi:hypothetical protein
MMVDFWAVLLFVAPVLHLLPLQELHLLGLVDYMLVLTDLVLLMILLLAHRDLNRPASL